MVQFIKVLGIAALVAASPVPNPQNVIIPIPDDPQDHLPTYCSSWDLTTAQGAKEAWDKASARILLDAYIQYQNNGPDQWLKNFEKFIFDPEAGGGKTKADNCAIIGQEECEPGHQLTCAEHFNNVNSSHAVGLWPKAAYWIFTAAQEVQLKLSRLDEALGREALITGLKIDQMVDDFDGDAEDSTDAFKWISAAFGLAGTVSGLIPGAGGAALGVGGGIISTILSYSSEQEREKVQGKDIKDALADMLDSTGESLRTTLRLAMGAAKKGENYDNLPASVEYPGTTSPVAKFFESGWWLVENDSGPVESIVDDMKVNLRRKVANNILKAAKYYLVANLNVERAADCGDQGRQWLNYDGTGYCFHLLKVEGDPHNKPIWSEPDADFYNVKMHNHHLGQRETYYKAILDCHKNGNSNKELEAGDITKPTRCFFNLPVAKTSWKNAGCQKWGPMTGCMMADYSFEDL